MGLNNMHVKVTKGMKVSASRRRIDAEMWLVVVPTVQKRAVGQRAKDRVRRCREQPQYWVDEAKNKGYLMLQPG